MVGATLLVTKTHIPPRRANLVQRVRLLARLDEGLLPGCKLILVSAPAGFGKTTLLSDWRLSLETRGIPLAWLSLDENDNDPARFLRYLVAALRRLLAGMGELTLSLLDAPQAPPVDVILTSLVNEIAELGQESVLVLDDVHLIHDAVVQQAIVFLLEHQPALLHLVILTRQDPLFPLARLRARGQVCEIRAADLRFSHEEADEFLQKASGLHLTPNEMAALETRIEGWIAGLQMATLALRGDAPLDLEGFSGSHHFVFDYLAEEVFVQQPPELVDFLQKTAFLERLCPALCDAVTGRTDSQQMLRRIEQANLFLSPLDDKQQWYRYHRLFADFIRSGAQRGDETELYGRAGAWFEKNDSPLEAMYYYRSANDWQAARRLIVSAGMKMYMDGEINPLDDWIRALPQEMLQGDGELLTYQGMVMIMKRQLQLTARVAEQAEAVWREDIPAFMRGCLYGVEAYLAHGAGREEEALSLAQAAIQLLNADQAGYRSMLLALIGQIYIQVGKMDAAEECLGEAIRLGKAQKNSVGVCVAQSNLGRAINIRGERRRADDYLRAVVGSCVDGRGRELPLTLFLYVAWAGVAYDANQIDTAREYLEKEFAYCKMMGIHPIIVGGVMTMALVRRAKGDLAGALEIIRGASEAATQYQIPWVARQAAALDAMLRLQAGDVAAATRWAEAADVTSAASLAVDREFELCCLGRTYNAEERYEKTLEVLAPLVAVAEGGGCRRSLITLELIQALAENGLERPAEALRRTCRALTLAAAQGYVRAFLDEGQVVLPLLDLAAAASTGEVQNFARELAQAVRASEVSERSAETALPKNLDAQGLVEALTPRELEVLRLMADGLSKAEIAARLFLTVNTLKAHSNSIYGKLDVHNRMQAVNQARALKLI